ncbi:MAG: DUF5658 family protein [Bryobacteraceae bacterium]
MTLTGLLLQYSYLQVLDFLTTVAFLMVGVEEGNPVVRLALELAPSPLYGLAFIKAGAILLGLYCLHLRKLRLLSRINLLFAIVVAWNLVALIVAAAHLGRSPLGA